MIVQTSQNPDGHFLGWAPGRGPIVAPTDMSWRLDQGADLVVQLHLLPQKTPVSVQPSIGLYFTDTPPARAPLMVKLGSKAIDIPAGNAAYEVTDRYVLPVDVDVLSVFPHAHYLGHEMHAIATLPDGTTRTLLRIAHWDFHWQQDYRFVTPVALPRGTTLAMRYTYDNSVNNEHNPQKPPKPVTYGPNSSDEMGDLWLQVLPHSLPDAATLVAGFAAHEAETNVTAAELLVRHAPDDAKNQTFLGGSYVGVGRHADALPHLEKAIQLDPRSASAHNYLGGALLPLGRTSEAIAQFRLATSLAADDERMQFNLGMALNASGSAAEAEKAFARAIALNADFADAHHNLGVLLLTRGQTAPAIDHLRRTVALEPNSADAHNDLGGAFASAGRIDEAIAEMKRALDLRPGDTATQQNLAILQQRRGR
jgi:Flp pilus assembly protein TadD